MVSAERTIHIAKIIVVVVTISTVGLAMAEMAAVAQSVVDTEQAVDTVLMHKEVLEEEIMSSAISARP